MLLDGHGCVGWTRLKSVMECVCLSSDGKNTASTCAFPDARGRDTNVAHVLDASNVVLTSSLRKRFLVVSVLGETKEKQSVHSNVELL